MFVGPPKSFRRERRFFFSAWDFVHAAVGAELASRGLSEGGLADCSSSSGSASSTSVFVSVDNTVGTAEDATEAGVGSEMVVHMALRDLRLIPELWLFGGRMLCDELAEAGFVLIVSAWL